MDDDEDDYDDEPEDEEESGEDWSDLEREAMKGMMVMLQQNLIVFMV